MTERGYDAKKMYVLCISRRSLVVIGSEKQGMEELLFEISGIFDQRADATKVYIQIQGALSQISVDLIFSFCREWDEKRLAFVNLESALCCFPKRAWAWNEAGC